MTTLERSIPPPRRDRTSVLLRQIMDDLEGEEVSVGELVHHLRRRSYGGLLLVLAVLGLLPGISLFAGLAMILPGFQMLAGFQVPVLPRLLRERRVSVAAVRSLGRRALPWFERCEKYIRPRWLVLSRRPMPMALGLVVIGLALVLLLPLPLSNFPPALALGFFALGIWERDGLMILIGLVLSAVAILVGVVMAHVAIEGLTQFINSRFD